MESELDHQLDHVDADRREQALDAWLAARPAGEDWPRSEAVNLHLHTFFSFNGENCSPTRLAVRARTAGLAVAGIVDFDVLDAVEEFQAAARRLRLRACTGIETRVYVPELADRVINSPGEPGIAYHMGIGIPRRRLAPPAASFLAGLKETAERRNRDLLQRVNAFLQPVTLDYDRDVLPLTPNGNATERHLCSAYAHQAATTFPAQEALAAYWSEKLATAIPVEQCPATPALLDLIRAKTMKRGGVGYVPPDATAFPRLQDMNAFVRAAGGIPCVAWLDGCSTGEQAMEEWLDVAMGSGVRALNIIPDRNYTPGVEDEKVAHLRAVIALAERRQLLLAVGTEMNAPGQKFVDDFASRELSPYRALFLRHAHILYAHTMQERYWQRGFQSNWAQATYPDIGARMDFFAALGEAVQPEPDEDRFRAAFAEASRYRPGNNH